MFGLMGLVLFQGWNVNISKSTLCGFVTVGMRYVDVMIYASMEPEKLSSLAPELRLRTLPYQASNALFRKLKRLSFPSAV